MLNREVTEDRVLLAELPGYRDYAERECALAPDRGTPPGARGLITRLIRIRHIMEYREICLPLSGFFYGKCHPIEGWRDMGR